MNFTGLGGSEVIYCLVLLIVLMTLMVSLLRSVEESLHHTGGKWQSIIDEILIGLVVLIAFTIIVQVESSSITSFLTRPFKWTWGFTLEALRFVGVRI